MKRLLTVLLTIMMACMAALPVYADDGNLTFTNGAEEFIYTGSEYSQTDLFTAMKDLMPGDVVHQTIYLHNDRAKDVKVKIYMKSYGANEGSEDFLSKLHLKVSAIDNTVMFDASPDQPAQLSEWYYIGTLFSGGDAELDLELTVPTSLGNEYMKTIGSLDWEFKVEEYPVDPDDPHPPQTGDSTALFVTLAAVSLAVLFIVLFLLKRRKDDEERQGMSV